MFEDYVNNGTIFCNKQGLRATELLEPETDRVEGLYKVTARVPISPFDVTDRFLFLNDSDFNSAGVLDPAKLLRVQTVLDRTGRGEREVLYCSSGAFNGKVGVEPRTISSVVFKGSVHSVSGDSILWFIDNQTNYLRAYNALTRARLSTHDISLGNGFWLGCLSDGIHIWVINALSRTAKAFNIETLSPATLNEISLGTGSWVGGMSDGFTLWFLNNSHPDSMLIAYNADTLGRDADKDIELGSGNFGGGTYSNRVIYVIEHTTGAIIAFNSQTRQRDQSKEFDIAGTNYTGLTALNENLWVINTTNNMALAYNLESKQQVTAQNISLGTGAWTGGTYFISINELATIPHPISDLYKQFSLDLIIREKNNPWIFDYTHRIPVVISLDQAFTQPQITYGNTNITLTKASNTGVLSVWYGTPIPEEVNQIFLK